MNCHCVNQQYCRAVSRNGCTGPRAEPRGIGFDMMTWVDPCKPGIDQIPASSVIGPDGIIAPAVETFRETSLPTKPAIPWWLIAVGGYLLYKQGTGL